MRYTVRKLRSILFSVKDQEMPMELLLGQLAHEYQWQVVNAPGALEMTVGDLRRALHGIREQDAELDPGEFGSLGNREKLEAKACAVEVDPRGKWRLYTTTIPKGFQVLGTVTVRGHHTGALTRSEAGVFVRVNAGVSSSLPQGDTLIALHSAGGGGAC